MQEIHARLGHRRALLLVGAAMIGSFAVAPVEAQGGTSSDPAQACASLADVTISAAQIGLPTSGAKVTSAALQPATEAGPASKPEFCKVLVRIGPADPRSEAVNVQLNLPTNWNGKALQMGGGGFNGFLVTAEGPGPGANAQAAPLARGYATFGSDGGHHVAGAFDIDGQTAAFMNDEALTNYGGQQLKKTHDVALALIRLRYGRAPQRIYFAGASAGGREALVVTQKWGTEYDGAIAFYPAAGGLPMLASFGRMSRALAAPGAYPGPAKQALLFKSAVAACDGADGATDGIISNPGRCGFDVATLRCPDGKDSGDTCLSDPQIAALRVMSSELRLRYPLASGETRIAGYNVFKGVDLTQRISGLGAAAPSARPVGLAQPVHDKFWDIFVRGWLKRDKDANSLAFDPENPGALQSRLSDLSLITSAWQSDLSAFKNHGGKLIIVHGNDDALVPVGWTESYYDRVTKKMGAASVNSFLRFYTVPGYGHGTGTFMADWDSLSALDQWVENGVAPSNPVAVDINSATRGRTRPLCRYPSWPKYSGSGDINKAGSFTCTGS